MSALLHLSFLRSSTQPQLILSLSLSFFPQAYNKQKNPPHLLILCFQSSLSAPSVLPSLIAIFFSYGLSLCGLLRVCYASTHNPTHLKPSSTTQLLNCTPQLPQITPNFFFIIKCECIWFEKWNVELSLVEIFPLLFSGNLGFCCGRLESLVSCQEKDSEYSALNDEIRCHNKVPHSPPNSRTLPQTPAPPLFPQYSYTLPAFLHSHTTVINFHSLHVMIKVVDNRLLTGGCTKVRRMEIIPPFWTPLASPRAPLCANPAPPDPVPPPKNSAVRALSAQPFSKACLSPQNTANDCHIANPPILSFVYFDTPQSSAHTILSAEATSETCSYCLACQDSTPSKIYFLMKFCVLMRFKAEPNPLFSPLFLLLIKCGACMLRKCIYSFLTLPQVSQYPNTGGKSNRFLFLPVQV
ncbi:hypothetical protein VP01_3008g1 [Puccinia sorghi]|uniref:Uncharacterized protein n=1 Tax=Puccinia sorghi TaxID=27349 RepID=A0A0L6V227_9BASI|nr:hypothetical protein VP01_3008g1 [Puccinia sorghi]